MHGFVSYRRFGKVRLLRSDRAWLVRGPMAILELVRGRFGFLSVAFGQLVFSGSIEIRTRFYRKVLCKDLFTKISFRKNVHTDFYGDFQTLILSWPILTPTRLVEHS
ncbi:hypothetical protein F2Q69_00005508 [Brassica cretica]|uniref:Uncharacterized protein n=1 Tax=Brassica cretica TaxID=69181 RepID=A0A8S9PEC6_BRACR|nr:hypothetical protein F2Q69_00005508 [Brassica cretica]